MLAIARFSLVIFMMPGIGEQVVSVPIRIAILIGLSLAVVSTGLVPAVSLLPLEGFVASLGFELLFGLFIGASLRGIIWVLNIVGAIVAQTVGLAQFLGVALQTDAQTIVANLLTMTGAAALLTINFHVYVFSSLVEMYNEIPVARWSDINVEHLVEALFSALSLAITLSWPFVVANLVYNICLGFINKAMPQLMVAFVGAPFMVGAGLFLLATACTSLFFVWLDRAPQIFGLG